MLPSYASRIWRSPSTMSCTLLFLLGFEGCVGLVIILSLRSLPASFVPKDERVTRLICFFTDRHLNVKSKRKIKAGTEITIAYGSGHTILQPRSSQGATKEAGRSKRIRAVLEGKIIRPTGATKVGTAAGSSTWM